MDRREEQQDTSDDGAPADTRELANSVDGVVDEHGWIHYIGRVGWIARGVVYVLVGVTATQIAGQQAPSDDASPEGSLGRVAEVPFGRVLLAVLAVGLALYVVWRVLSVITIRGHGWSQWAARFGYAGSGLFYLLLAWSASKAVSTGVDPKGSNSVERSSKLILEAPGGRVVLGLAGLVATGVGVYFAVDTGIRRTFVDELSGVERSLGDNDTKHAALVVAGIAGWIGRGIVTSFVGFFVVRAALQFDPDEARRFDKTLREVAGTTTGSAIVLVCALGLLCYGVFCLASQRFRSLDAT